MVETPASQIWAMRATYVLLAAAIVFFQLIPLDTVPRNWAAPDVLMALTFAWALRRPDYVPAIMIAAVMLFSDLMLHRPPGLMALLVLLASERLKRRVLRVRNEGFVSEMVTVGLSMIAVVLAMRLCMAIFMVPRPPLGLSVFQLGVTILSYPVVVFVSGLIFGVRVRSPGDEATGGRLP